MNRKQRECESKMRKITNGERGCADPSAHLSRIERFLIRLGILATTEQSESLSRVDEDIDHRADHQRWLRRGYRLVCGRKDCPWRTDRGDEAGA